MQKNIKILYKLYKFIRRLVNIKYKKLTKKYNKNIIIKYEWFVILFIIIFFIIYIVYFRISNDMHFEKYVLNKCLVKTNTIRQLKYIYYYDYDVFTKRKYIKWVGIKRTPCKIIQIYWWSFFLDKLLKYIFVDVFKINYVSLYWYECIKIEKFIILNFLIYSLISLFLFCLFALERDLENNGYTIKSFESLILGIFFWFILFINNALILKLLFIINQVEKEYLILILNFYSRFVYYWIGALIYDYLRWNHYNNDNDYFI